MRKISRLIGTLTLVFAVISCGGSTAPGDGGGGGGGGNNCPANTFCMGATTFYTAASFTTTTLTVPINTPVTWFNNSGGTPHDVVFDDQSAALAVGTGSAGDIPIHSTGSNQRKFANPGSYAFHCTQHTPGMVGTVIVQ